MNLLIMVLIRPKIRIFGHLERLDFETCFFEPIISYSRYSGIPILILPQNETSFPTPKSSQHNINLSVIMSEIMSLINR